MAFKIRMNLIKTPPQTWSKRFLRHDPNGSSLRQLANHVAIVWEYEFVFPVLKRWVSVLKHYIKFHAFRTLRTFLNCVLYVPYVVPCFYLHRVWFPCFTYLCVSSTLICLHVIYRNLKRYWEKSTAKLILDIYIILWIPTSQFLN